MKKILLLCFCLVSGLAWSQRTLPQAKKIRTTASSDLIFLPAKGTVCYSTGQTDSRIGPPPEFLQRRGGRTTATTAQIIVDYEGFSDSARTAFQYAVDIWSSLIVSPVPIRVRAIWTNLGGNANGSIVLGGARPYAYVAGVQGALKANTAYPIALAEKLARQNLNGDQPDIYCQFNSNSQVNWYLGTDGATNGSRGRQDLVTVVTHELGHGLGFTSSFYAENPIGVWGNDSNYGYPETFDHFVVNASNQQLIDQTLFSNPSNELYRQLTSNNLFFNGPLATQRNGGTKPKLYAPTTYSVGSSISHLDETTYRTGTANALMTPSLAQGEVNQNPGPIVMNIFTDMGWKSTSILHERLRDSEDLLGRPITFRATVVSDTSLKGNVRLSYTINDTTRANATTVNMTQSGSEYTYTLAASNTPRIIRYWITAEDNSNRVFTSPAEAPGRALWTFRIGTDNTPPTITHVPQSTILSTADSLILDADVFDDFDFGIDTTYIEYRINGVAQPSVPMPRLGYYVTNGIRSNNIYAVGVLTFASGRIKGGDKIEYRIVARDRSKARNQGTLPATGYFTVNVAGVGTAVTEYVNDFNATTAANDFSGNGFQITTPTGFLDAAIHSDHPYVDGPASQGYEANYTYILLKPIQLSDQDPFIRFDEICLVEPGATGSIFGSSDFYDYVVVEGSRDGGKTWVPFDDGWDARANNEWLTAYNSQLVRANGAENSTYAGTAGLYKRREVNMLGSGYFSPGQQVLVRFRLFADQLSHGWGWSIDNLYIQRAKPVVTSVEPTLQRATIAVSPNPSNTGEFLVEADFPAVTKSLGLSVTNLFGQSLYQKTIANPGSLRERLSLTNLPAGTYLIRFQTDAEVITRRVVIAK
ncbi:T9SS type A sorting domain-containing protein [Siphonobacter sp.]|uniref:T9SS type A sorting domain-containing protein n=1 Tax=Siphonobacter sp. TaxID=1869184 RepID=UPI003B3A329E